MEGTVVSHDITTDLQPELQPDDNAIESRLSEEIASLWSAHLRVHADHKTTAKELRLIRASLAQRLYEVKALLSRPGRSGQWRSWLLERHIPRSTADRLAARHAETLASDTGNVLSGASNGDPVEELLRSLLPRLRRVLTTPAAVHRFITAVAGTFDFGCEVEERGMLIIRPAEQNVTEALAEAPVPDNITAAAVTMNAVSAAATNPEPATPPAAAFDLGVREAMLDEDVL